MKKTEQNIKVIAENKEGKNGFAIYLLISGRKEYLMHHRHNGLLYDLLEPGISLGDFRRWKASSMCRRPQYKYRDRRDASVRMQNSIQHLILVIDEYLMYA